MDLIGIFLKLKTKTQAILSLASRYQNNFKEKHQQIFDYLEVVEYFANKFYKVRLISKRNCF